MPESTATSGAPRRTGSNLTPQNVLWACRRANLVTLREAARTVAVAEAVLASADTGAAPVTVHQPQAAVDLTTQAA